MAVKLSPEGRASTPASVLIFLLQGFAFGGFKLSETVLKFIGAATIGEIGGLLTLSVRAVFVKK